MISKFSDYKMIKNNNLKDERDILECRQIVLARHNFRDGSAKGRSFHLVLGPMTGRTK